MDRIVYDAYEELKKFATCAGKYVSNTEIEDILRNLKSKEYHNDKMLRAVMVGRTNAGKSSLTNAFIGKAIAPVKARESTSWNTNFWPSDVEYCISTNNNDELEEISVEEYVKIVNSPSKRVEYLYDKKSIDLFYKTDDIQFAILDVPGIFTQNKQNEVLAFDAIRQADLVLLVIPGDASVSEYDRALFEETKKNNKPVEFIISKADYLTEEEIKEMKAEIQKVFQVKQEVYSISANKCIKGDSVARVDRKKIIEKINQYQVFAKETRRRNAASFEQKSIRMLRELQEKLLHDIDKKFSKKYEEQNKLYLKAEQLTQIVREELKQSAEEMYCAPYKEEIISRMTSVSTAVCKSQAGAIIYECVPEGYMIDYWSKEVERISALTDRIWEKEVGETEELTRYVDILKRGRQSAGIVNYKNADAERIFGGVRTAASLGTVISFYQAVLGPAAQYITLTSAMTSVGLPLAAIGAGLSVVFGLMSSSGKEQISREEVEQILSQELKKSSKEMMFHLIDIIENINKEYITEAIKEQEEKLLQSLPMGMNGVDVAIDALENLRIKLFNRELELTTEIDFCNVSLEQMRKIEYVDPVEQTINDFTSRLNSLNGSCYIESSISIPFMPILFLSDENKEHVFGVLTDMCIHTTVFEKKVKDTQFEYSYVYEDEVCAIYFSHEPNKKKIVLEYIDVFQRDELNTKLFEKRIREGSVLSDCQMRRKILSDISHAKERVEILVPWMNAAMDSISNCYKMTMSAAIGQALKNGATVVIGCGNSENHEKENEVTSRERKEKLEEVYKKYCETKKLIFHMKSFTHEKFLVVDNRIAMCGSYNFLSNNGRFDNHQFEHSKTINKYNSNRSNGGSSETEHPGESMKITENVEGVRMILNRMQKKYN